MRRPHRIPLPPRRSTYLPDHRSCQACNYIENLATPLNLSRISITQAFVNIPRDSVPNTLIRAFNLPNDQSWTSLSNVLQHHVWLFKRQQGQEVSSQNSSHSAAFGKLAPLSHCSRGRSRILRLTTSEAADLLLNTFEWLEPYRRHAFRISNPL
ncbi:hypothetical protein EJ08DRAFT_649711 [Tothia fuscella]|uniref:Uncharacterized protein n=1 Tax=Tothia fuscella TaxID=1048955 RepID=A0A9P4NRN3_9PEZI|nr:hypothetical protein EJ08DRAFT_649711 [Tothia fuscella]